jgi:hypothetical protein
VAIETMFLFKAYLAKRYAGISKLHANTFVRSRISTIVARGLLLTPFRALSYIFEMPSLAGRSALGSYIAFTYQFACETVLEFLVRSP